MWFWRFILWSDCGFLFFFFLVFPASCNLFFHCEYFVLCRIFFPYSQVFFHRNIIFWKGIGVGVFFLEEWDIHYSSFIVMPLLLLWFLFLFSLSFIFMLKALYTLCFRTINKWMSNITFDCQYILSTRFRKLCWILIDLLNYFCIFSTKIFQCCINIL